ncbi:MAG: carbohydrate porin, partial [Sedimentisphaerales bacterium]|nr:carbohydrate porin [Sedimentisphaerales bacterium]
VEGEIFLHGEGGWGNPDEGPDESSIGSMLGANADYIGSRSLDIVELFYQADLTDSFSLTVGKIDFTGFFDASAYANDEASQFLNGALVNNPSIPFPDYSLGVIAGLTLNEELYVQAGIADAQADGRETGFSTAFGGEDYYFYIAEAQYSLANELPSSFTLGIWHDGQPKAATGVADPSRSDVGMYFNIDQKLINESDDAQQGLALFFRYGCNDHKNNDIHNFVSGGFHYQGLLPGRDADTCGLGYANARLTDYVADAYPAAHEGVCEGFYNCCLNEYVSITPALQYITNPGGAVDTGSALAGSLRMQVSF